MTTPRKPAAKAAAASSPDLGIGAGAKQQKPALAAVFAALQADMDAALPQAASSIWHGAPVWFIEDYPVVDYSLKAGKASLLFWNGPSLGEPTLKPVGKHFAAEWVFAHLSDLDRSALRRTLVKAGKKVFKDHASLRKAGGVKGR
jgi:hypothetical protein